jgi:multiple sugar transport system permease protein
METSTIIPRKVSRIHIKTALIPWLFVLPGIVFTIWIRYYPIIQSFYMSLFEYDTLKPPGKFIGIRNYTSLLSQQYYWEAWKNTLVYLLLIILISFIPPLIQAFALSEITKGRKLFSTIYLITALIPLTINVILWKWIWHPDYGAINTILKALGMHTHLWLNDTQWVKFCIIFPGIIGGGVSVLIYLAAILGVPQEITESAQIDGCTGFKRILLITLPNITYVIFIQMIMAVIGALQLLDAPFQYTAGGPAGSSTSMGLFIYNTVQQDLSYGRSSAASVILFVVIAALTIVQVNSNKSQAQ